jgi:hypothetical protein
LIKKELLIRNEGLPTVTPVPTAGLREQSTSGRFKETFGRVSGKVGRPCHNGDPDSFEIIRDII